MVHRIDGGFWGAWGLLWQAVYRRSPKGAFKLLSRNDMYKMDFVTRPTKANAVLSTGRQSFKLAPGKDMALLSVSRIFTVSYATLYKALIFRLLYSLHGLNVQMLTQASGRACLTKAPSSYL